MQLTTGIMWVTPSPESIAVPVRVLALTFLEVKCPRRCQGEDYCTAMYTPGKLNISNIISAVYSRFSGKFKGGSVWTTVSSRGSIRAYQQEIKGHSSQNTSYLKWRFLVTTVPLPYLKYYLQTSKQNLQTEVPIQTTAKTTLCPFNRLFVM